jgi:protein required for attachment to host cells
VSASPAHGLQRRVLRNLALDHANRRIEMTKTTTRLTHHAWFALTDTESCRLLCCSLTLRGKYHVDEYDTLANTLPEQEHMRPMTNAGTTHNVENKERRFATEIVEWLKKKTNKHGMDHLIIFAPPRLLGVLRMVPLGALKGHVEELQGDLMRLNPGQLADHPRIRELVPQHPSNKRAACESVPMSISGEVADGRPDQPDGRRMTA